MKRTIKVLQLPNGNYIEDYQYSQGHKDLVETSDVLKAANFYEVRHNLEFAQKLFPQCTLKVGSVTLTWDEHETG